MRKITPGELKRQALEELLKGEISIEAVPMTKEMNARENVTASCCFGDFLVLDLPKKPCIAFFPPRGSFILGSKLRSLRHAANFFNSQ